ncbi:MAG: hypothetical protein JNK25_04170 [Phycisphaerae bacterium]|nr:hypothetical protein [Phycisphaerae bacterium]
MTLHPVPTTDPPARIGDAHIADAVAHHRTLLQRLEELSDRQRELAGAGDGEAVLTLLSVRMGLIADIAAQADRLRDIADAAHALQDAERQSLMEELSQLDELTRSALARDAQDRRTLEEARDRLAIELRGVCAAERAQAAYTSRGPAAPRVQDARG